MEVRKWNGRGSDRRWMGVEWRFGSGVEGAQKGDRRGSNEVWTGAGLTKRVGVVEWRFGTETRKGAGLS